jgi:hypothetical protein
VFGEETIDGRLEVDGRTEDSAFQSPFGQLSEETFDGIDPRTWRKVTFPRFGGHWIKRLGALPVRG